MKQKILAAAALLLMGLAGEGTARAAVIAEQGYGYVYGDTVKSLDADSFLVCGECRPDKLKKLPARQIVAIKLNPPPVVAQPNHETDKPEEAVVPPAVTEKPQGLSGQKKAQAAKVIGTVLFGFDTATVSESERRKLDYLLSGVPAGSEVSLDGYTCTAGTEQHNLELSKRRAQAVAKYLSGRGAQIGSVTGKGECCQVSENKSLNRRVEIKNEEKN